MIKGCLDRLHFGDLLQWFHMGNVSGRLTLMGGRGERRLDFNRGKVCFVSSTVPEERLASWIAARSLLNTTNLRRVLATSMLRRELFTDLLLADGACDAVQLKSGLTDLAETVTGRVLLSPRVDFEFDPEYPVRDVLGLNLDVTPSQLLLEAARRSDERDRQTSDGTPQELPLGGEAFESLFWDLVRDGITADDPVDGTHLTAFHDQVQDIVNTLAHWLASSPGLVPLPSGQIAAISGEVSGRDPDELFGLPHVTWDEMVLARALYISGQQGPLTMAEIETATAEINIVPDLVAADFLQRPDAGRLDRLVRRLVSVWSRTAAAAAPHLGVNPRTASLAVHLVSVPTDLVLWVLTRLPVPHRQLRKALLQHLSRRVGARLARLADFPTPFRDILTPLAPTPLGVCLNLGRQSLSAVAGWPPTVPDGEGRELEVASATVLALAADAARQTAEETDADVLAVG
jgi:hypothetical protein